MYRIAKTWRFAAAHHLPTLPETHKCHRPHGHNYAVTLVIESDALDGHGFVVDYGEMDKRFGSWLKAAFDHQDLNAVMDISPTAENLAEHCHDMAYPMFAHLGPLTVRVAETDGTWAEYSE